MSRNLQNRNAKAAVRQPTGRFTLATIDVLTNLPGNIGIHYGRIRAHRAPLSGRFAPVELKTEDEGSVAVVA